MIAAALAIALLAGGCSRALTEDDLVEAYQDSNSNASATMSECIVGALVDRFGVDGVEAELEAIAPTQDFERTQYQAEFRCGDTDDVETQIEVLLTARDGNPEAAACVATALVPKLDDADLEVLLSGEMTDQFFDKYFVAVSDCDALPR